jgi:nucleotide-binding universal stress UspA family protein
MKVLLAIDDSTYSTEAVGMVGARPWPSGTTIRVLAAVQILPPLMADGWDDVTGSLERVQQDLCDHAAQLTRRAAKALQTAGLIAEPLVREGDARSVIVDEAKEWDADLIVVGSPEHTGLKRLLIGSVAQSVVSHAPCSVEVVRAKTTLAA